MKRTFLFGAALTGLLFAGASARAGLVAWTYNWTPTVSAVFADSPGTSKITLTNEPLGSVVGSSDIVATNLKVFSTATPTTPDTFTHAAYGLSLTLFDTASNTSGTLHFTGEFNGTVSSASSLITNSFTSALTGSLVLGGNLYTVTMGQFTPPAPPGAANSGSISATAIVRVGEVNKTPEPSTMALAGLGLAFLGFAGWRKYQQKIALNCA